MNVIVWQGGPKQMNERDRQTCLSLALFVKGLAVKRREQIEAEAARKAHAEAVEKHRRRKISAEKIGYPPPPPPPPPPPEAQAVTDDVTISLRQQKAIELMQAASRHRREKSTRETVLVRAEGRAAAAAAARVWRARGRGAWGFMWITCG